MRAVARTHRATGAPITVHTHPGTETGLVVKQVMCDEEGVDADPGGARAHSATAPTSTTQRPGRPRASSSAWTASGSTSETTFEAQGRHLIEMCRRGYADRMVLSHDTSCYLDMDRPTDCRR